jgi:hypothetical protein
MQKFREVLSSDKTNFQKLIELIDISTDVFLDQSSSHELRNIAGLIWSWQILAAKQIPFELWSDICKEGLNLLEKLLEDPSIPYKELPGFDVFQKHVQAKYLEIEKRDPALGYKLGDMGY